ncbi:hypothetical protein PVAP13_5NG157981 [Panicum virgatum]|uniref:Uncharacterized protein n=1 Tax=Panicum virgatum TaxID=38727 RepID=A0A8T0RT19_PANVG|nr:hypothetical protein PVAP13_5NG157981 [Panicum virgatum]
MTSRAAYAYATPSVLARRAPAPTPALLGASAALLGLAPRPPRRLHGRRFGASRRLPGRLLLRISKGSGSVLGHTAGGCSPPPKGAVVRRRCPEARRKGRRSDRPWPRHARGPPLPGPLPGRCHAQHLRRRLPRDQPARGAPSC